MPDVQEGASDNFAQTEVRPGMSDVLQRAAWDGQPVSLGFAFMLQKARGGGDLLAICSLQSHVLGWELVLEVNGLPARSRVCRSRDEVLDVSEQWCATMRDQGWT